MSESAGKFRKVPGSAGKCREASESAGKSRKALGSTGIKIPIILRDVKESNGIFNSLTKSSEVLRNLKVIQGGTFRKLKEFHES